MKKKHLIAALAATIVATGTTAQTDTRDRYHSDRGSDRAYRGSNRTYRGSDGRYYQDCKRSSGTTGTIAGGAGGALAGHVLGGGTLGTVAGGVGGALLGRHLDKKHDAAQNRKNGC